MFGSCPHNEGYKWFLLQQHAFEMYIVRITLQIVSKTTAPKLYDISI